MSPSDEKYYIQKRGGIVKAPPTSNIEIERFSYSYPIDNPTINYHKGSIFDPKWIEAAPNEKKPGEKRYSLTKKFSDGSSLVKTIIVKDNSLFTITIINQKSSKSIPKDSAEKLIETIYSRF
jgi:hypothetical protein